MKATKIGTIEKGIDGGDEYLRIDLDEQDPEGWKLPEVTKYLNELYFCPSRHPGAYFCHRVTVMPNPYHDDSFVAVIHHQYDV